MVGNILCTSTTRPANPTPGMRIYETDTKTERLYDSVQGWMVWPPVPVVAEDYTAIGGITSTGFAVGSPACDVTFVAPPSGRARIELVGYVTNSSASISTVLTFEVRLTNAAGAVFIAAGNGNAVMSPRGQAGNSRVISYFAPNTQYYLRTMHAVDNASTGNVYLRRVAVTPLPS